MTQDIMRDSNIVKKLILKRTEISALIKNIAEKTIATRTLYLLQHKVFLVLVDESTEISKMKNLYILARYIDKGKIKLFIRLFSGKRWHIRTFI
jgi:tmRNA-binding protein